MIGVRRAAQKAQEPGLQPRVSPRHVNGVAFPSARNRRIKITVALRDGFARCDQIVELPLNT